METLTTLGPTAVPPGANTRRGKNSEIRRQTVAWSEHGSESRADDRDGATNSSGLAAQRRGSRQRATKPIHKLALLIVICQAAWAWVIPLKNIATVTFPTTRPDSIRTQTLPYMDNGTDMASAFSVESPLVIPGTEIVPLLKQVLDVVLMDNVVLDQLQELGTLDVPAVYKLLDVDEFAVMTKYYSLLLQSTEFPGGKFTTRSFRQEGDLARLAVLLRASSSDVADAAYDVACYEENAFLKATTCARDVDGCPCDSNDTVAHTFNDVKLQGLADGTGLDNNVALLFVVDYFHQAISTLLATKDWSNALDDLNFNQSTERALEVGTASVFKDGLPYLLESDAFLVGVQAARMDTFALDSCVSAEIIVGQFYIRTFVLTMIQDALVEYGMFGGTTPTIAVPKTMDAVLEPLWSYSIALTSGARTRATQTSRTRFYKSTVGTVRTSVAQIKFDRKEASADQVLGSSMRLLQYMVYYEDVVSKFESVVSATGAYDTQTYKLIGWVGSDISTFWDSFTANSMMVYSLAELATDKAPTGSWWDDEEQYAAYFKTLEASDAAPFKVFDTHLSITSVARATPLDDKTETRCQRALFKVIGKIAYLALLELSTPASYLMFMGEVASGAKAWLISQAFSDELVAESFSGERLGFPYRNGAYTRKDDGSAWVTVPLLDAMIRYFGSDATATALLQEIDSSLKIFLKESNGNINFPDAAACRVSGLAGAGKDVKASDSLDDIYDKILPGLQSAILDVLEMTPTLASEFEAAMVADKVPWVTLTREQLRGSPVVTSGTEGHGPPTADWKPTAFTAGMRKFWPPKTPTDVAVTKLRESTVCYKVLDLRYMNVSTRCFAEPSNGAIVKSEYRSESMRKFFQLVWSMAIMLNTMAFVVVLKYIRKLYKAWMVTRFECLHVDVALQLNLQGMGVLNISQSMLLLIASLPALVTFHIPDDPVFLPYYKQEKLPKAVIDVFVTLAMSWFVKLGFDVCNTLIKPKRPVDWYYLFRVRWFMLLVILVLRLITPEKIHHESYLMAKLVLTCVVSLLLGACCTCVIFLPERPGKVVDADSKDSHDAVVAALVKQNMPLTRYGVLGRTSKGWSKTGLIVEGWRLGRTADGDEVLRKDGGEILLPKTSELEGDFFVPGTDENAVVDAASDTSASPPAAASSTSTEVTL